MPGFISQALASPLDLNIGAGLTDGVYPIKINADVSTGFSDDSVQFDIVIYEIDITLPADSVHHIGDPNTVV